MPRTRLKLTPGKGANGTEEVGPVQLAVESCDELRGGMDASQYKDYILALLFVKYVTDKAKSDPDAMIDVPAGGSFDDILALKGNKEIGEKINMALAKLAKANDLEKVIDLADFNDEERPMPLHGRYTNSWTPRDSGHP